MRPLLLLLAVTASVSTDWLKDEIQRHLQTIDDPLQLGSFMNLEDLQSCYANLRLADTNNNTRINSTEYVGFAKLQSPDNLLNGIDTFTQLPVAFQAAFLGTACLCQDPLFGGNASDVNCCLGTAAHIRVPPTAPVADWPLSERLYLFAACSYTTSAAEAVVGSPAPTFAPTLPPTSMPSSLPSAVQSAMPSVSPTLGPSLVPSLVPSPAPVSLIAEVPYDILVEGGQLQDTDEFTAGYLADLIAAMNTVAPVVAEDSLGRRRLQSRRLSIKVALPTSAGNLVDIDCPPGVGEFDLCQTVPALITLLFADETDPDAILADFETALKTAIGDGALQLQLDAINPDSPVTILDSLAPAPSPVVVPTVLAEVMYQIFVSNGLLDASELLTASYTADLVRAMNSLAPLVAAETFGRRRLRRLEVTVQWPTDVGALTNFECPEGLDANDLCQNVNAMIVLILIDEPSSDQVVADFETALMDAIDAGQLQTELEAANPATPVTILNSYEIPPPDTSTKLSGGATAGIVIGALVGVGLAAGLLLLSRRQQGAGAGGKGEYEPYEQAHGDPSTSEADVQGEKELESQAAALASSPEPYAQFSPTSGSKQVAPLTTTLGASQPDYGRTSRKALEAMAAGEDIVAEPALDVEPDSSSNAGSSGWSSSAGLSSMNTGSVDDSMDAAAAAGATLAAISASSALSRKVTEQEADKTSSAGSESDGPIAEITRPQLDSLIEAGDWAAVGATAALLAAASDSASATSKSHVSGISGRSRDTNSLDAARAAELDNLVDAGDWEGVVLAAAKFEAAEASGGEEDTSSHASGSASASGSQTRSDSASKALLRAEKRAEVEALVRRVVPDEIDNIDAMMEQFKGREDELIETLRTMQERDVARKARAAGQKAAKVDARANVVRGGLSTDSSSLVTGDSSSLGLADQHRTALELAIEAGDWEAVGEAAALMSDASVGDDDGGDSSAASSSRRSRSTLEGAEAERAKELDAMIDKGDWTGIVAATKRFKEVDEKKKSSRTKEEEEALAEAEAWMRIAEEARTSATDAGAEDAAEWAIQRSLSQLKQAEKQQKKTDTEEDEV